MIDLYTLPDEGLLRPSQIHRPNGFLPISRSHYWAMTKAGLLPPTMKLSPGVTVIRVGSLREALAKLSGVR